MTAQQIKAGKPAVYEHIDNTQPKILEGSTPGV
jgi:hypothetical protein